MEPKLLIAHVACEDAILTADVLQIGAELWLIPQWLETQDGQWRTPERAIRVDLLPHQMSGAHGSDMTLNSTMPRSVIDGLTSHAEGVEYETVRGPSDHFGWIAARRGQ